MSYVLDMTERFPEGRYGIDTSGSRLFDDIYNAWNAMEMESKAKYKFKVGQLYKNTYGYKVRAVVRIVDNEVWMFETNGDGFVSRTIYRIHTDEDGDEYIRIRKVNGDIVKLFGIPDYDS